MIIKTLELFCFRQTLFTVKLGKLHQFDFEDIIKQKYISYLKLYVLFPVTFTEENIIKNFTNLNY